MSNDLRNLFKPEAFVSDMPGAYMHIYDAAKQAQAILNEALDKAVRVYGHFDGKTFHVPDSKLGLKSGTANPDTHQALLVQIEELPKKECEHEPKRWVHPNEPDTFEMVCYHCDMPLEAEWKVRK